MTLVQRANTLTKVFEEMGFHDEVRRLLVKEDPSRSLGLQWGT
jgi:hypothetical protein